MLLQFATIYYVIANGESIIIWISFSNASLFQITKLNSKSPFQSLNRTPRNDITFCFTAGVDRVKNNNNIEGRFSEVTV